MFLRPPRSTLFPYTTLFRSRVDACGVIRGLRIVGLGVGPLDRRRGLIVALLRDRLTLQRVLEIGLRRGVGGIDRKSTRLNSSHRCTSYAVFCLKKKKIYMSPWLLRITVIGSREASRKPRIHDENQTVT